MAYKFELSTPLEGMTHIWNVSQHVGWEKTNPNLPTDVELCQFFIRELLKGGFTGKRANAAAHRPEVKKTGIFDAVLGFWIFELQGAPGAVADGVISPANGFTYDHAHGWLITQLNVSYFLHLPELFATLDRNPHLSHQL